MINWDDIRKQFPVTENSTYLNAAAAGPLARATMAAATAGQAPTPYRSTVGASIVVWDPSSAAWASPDRPAAR